MRSQELRVALRLAARRMVLLPLLLATLCFAQSAVSEPSEPGGFSIDFDRLPVASLDGLWRFHAGDDPGFASPAFNDSAWRLVHSDQSWVEQHLPIAVDTFWYRTRIFIPAGSRPVSLYIPGVEMNYQVYRDGQFIGGVGAMPPHPHMTTAVPMVFEIFPERSPQPRVVFLAIRCWRWPPLNRAFAHGLKPGIRIGATPLIRQNAVLDTRQVFWSSSSVIFLTLLETLAGLAAFGLYLFRRHEKEYVWYGLYCLLSAASRCLGTWRSFHAIDIARFLLLQDILTAAYFFALMAFLYRLLGGRRDWLFWGAVASTLASLALSIVDFVPWIVSSSWILVNQALFDVLQTFFVLPYVVWFMALLIRKAAAGNADAGLLLPATMLAALGPPISGLLDVGKYFFGWSGLADWFYRTAQWPFPFSLQNIADALFLGTMLTIVLRRFSRSTQQQEELEREREAARAVQQVLIPEDIPKVPGYEIASIYEPFGEVGGDFFQILPLEKGSVLIAIGDVSGKGMPAAMTVALLVGTLRTLAVYVQSPGEILKEMNQRMIGRTKGGFTTCLVLRADLDGKMVIANAGHISPYKNGSELALDNGLPLGLAESATYNEVILDLPPNEQMTLLTDGVVEARSKTGELFGFDRTAAIATQSAEFIALAAQNFGQDDDVTVLTLTRHPAGERSTTQVLLQGQSPTLA
jgi:hypothetical protein